MLCGCFLCFTTYTFLNSPIGEIRPIVLLRLDGLFSGPFSHGWFRLIYRVMLFFERAGKPLQNRLVPVPACSLPATQSCLLIFTLAGDVAGLHSHSPWKSLRRLPHFHRRDNHGDE